MIEVIDPAQGTYQGYYKELLENAHEGSLYNALYSNAFKCYQIEYNSNQSFVDKSLLLIEDKLPLLALSYAQHELNELTQFSFFGNAVYLLENKNMSSTQRERAHKLLRKHIDELVASHPKMKIYVKDTSEQLGLLARLFLEKGADVKLKFTQVIDLRKSEEELKKDVRHSFHSLISWGDKNISTQLLESKNFTSKCLEGFRNLHISVAGRETRSEKSWRIQEQIIQENEAFALLGTLENKLETAALFHYSKSHCYYGVSASNRELFEKPLLHSLLWNAILHAKKLGCIYFELGEQYFVESDVVTKKDVNISTFKRGFGGEIHKYCEVTFQK